MSIRLTVYGAEPAPQGSKRSVGHNRFVEASKKVAPYREAIVSQIQRDGLDQTLLAGPVKVIVTFMFIRPKAHFGTRNKAPYLRDDAPRYVTRAPDLDKIQRALGDALTQGGILTDDSLIVEWQARKMYGERYETIIEVIPLFE